MIPLPTWLKPTALLAAIAAIFVIASLGPADAASPQPALSTGVTDAFHVRMLQSELMVGAMSCNATILYNSFVRKFSKDLMANGNALRAHFSKTFGTSANRRLDEFITRLANAASLMSLDRQSFCGGVRLVFDRVLLDTKANLNSIAAERAKTPAWRNEGELASAVRFALQ